MHHLSNYGEVVGRSEGYYFTVFIFFWDLTTQLKAINIRQAYVR